MAMPLTQRAELLQDIQLKQKKSEKNECANDPEVGIAGGVHPRRGNHYGSEL